MLTGPAPSSLKALKIAGMSTSDIDLWELNEAFASVVLLYMKLLNIPHDKINVNGGAIAMGHPLGATGAIVLGTLLDEMERRDLSTGLCLTVHRGRHGHRHHHRTRIARIKEENMNNTIQYAVDQDGIALLTIDLPGMPMNVLTPELMEDLATLTEQAASDDEVKGMVITSGKKAFIAGADIKDMVTAYDRGVTHKEAAEFSGKLNQTLRKMETCGKPVAVAINGLALGGGLEVCLACHYRVLANDTGAVLGFPEVNIGLLPGAGGTQTHPTPDWLQATRPRWFCSAVTRSRSRP